MSVGFSFSSISCMYTRYKTNESVFTNCLKPSPSQIEDYIPATISYLEQEGIPPMPVIDALTRVIADRKSLLPYYKDHEDMEGHKYIIHVLSQCLQLILKEIKRSETSHELILTNAFAELSIEEGSEAFFDHSSLRNTKPSNSIKNPKTSVNERTERQIAAAHDVLTFFDTISTLCERFKKGELSALYLGLANRLICYALADMFTVFNLHDEMKEFLAFLNTFFGKKLVEKPKISILWYIMEFVERIKAEGVVFGEMGDVLRYFQNIDEDRLEYSFSAAFLNYFAMNPLIDQVLGDYFEFDNPEFGLVVAFDIFAIISAQQDVRSDRVSKTWLIKRRIAVSRSFEYVTDVMAQLPYEEIIAELRRASDLLVPARLFMEFLGNLNSATSKCGVLNSIMTLTAMSEAFFASFQYVEKFGGEVTSALHLYRALRLFGFIDAVEEFDYFISVFGKKFLRAALPCKKEFSDLVNYPKLRIAYLLDLGISRQKSETAGNTLSEKAMESMHSVTIYDIAPLTAFVGSCGKNVEVSGLDYVLSEENVRVLGTDWACIVDALCEFEMRASVLKPQVRCALRDDSWKGAIDGILVLITVEQSRENSTDFARIVLPELKFALEVVKETMKASKQKPMFDHCV